MMDWLDCSELKLGAAGEINAATKLPFDLAAIYEGSARLPSAVAGALRESASQRQRDSGGASCWSSQPGAASQALDSGYMTLHSLRTSDGSASQRPQAQALCKMGAQPCQGKFIL